MTSYQHGKIYKITSDETEQIYIGSTIQPLHKRLIQHRNKYKRYKNGTYHYLSSFEIVNYDDAVIILIENYPCNTKEELFIREQYWKDNLDNTVNTQNMYNKKKPKYTNYNDAKIYKITSSKTDNIYI
ncbi:hypothetical protein Klosneuvirus_5_60 [Klosneuvirus KNV1]|uniref:GIY-YIG domain-containing protein n=1 Tax=Klosneuvirus KNV1 TaxID=1977640 RepID=A0A1V0SKY7_9VIRU|nr:hypothetical protein Klosneuvirus_5_60 [Klosneuvirus KNV1]